MESSVVFVIPLFLEYKTISCLSQLIECTMEGTESLSLIPLAGMILYMGLISGYIPSPLYQKNTKWPKEYALFQLVFLTMTAVRLAKHSSSSFCTDKVDYEYANNLEELSEFTNWLGDSLHFWFYTYFKEDALKVIIEIGLEFIWLGLFVFLAVFVDQNEKLRKWNDARTLPMPIVFLRNLILFVCSNVYSCWETLFSPESIVHCETAYNVTPGLIAPDYPISQLMTEFADAWKVFHPSDLVLVRLSHSILYPTVLLLLTRRRLTTFLIWLVFYEIDFFQVLADMFHYVSGPELAEARLDFQDGTRNECFVNVRFVQTMMQYPLNFLFLTTSMGDTSSSSE